MQDVTQYFTSLCNELPTGSMVKPPELTMLDAMNAIQMMDHKMDSGSSKLSPSRPPSSYDPDSRICPEGLCWIIDALVSLEIAWYRGATLCQSVYTALLYHNPQHLAGPSRYPSDDQMSNFIYLVLRAYTLLYCKTIDLVYTELAKGNVRDGEDCWLDHYGVPVRMNDPTGDLVSLANEALQWLESDNCQMDPYWREQTINRLLCRRPSVTGLTAFDSSMPSYLRQNMPLPAFHLPQPEESWQNMRSMLDGLVDAESVREQGSWEKWESQFDFSCNQLLKCDTYLNDEGVLSTFLSESGLVDSTISAFESASCGQDASANRQIAAWKRLISSHRPSSQTAHDSDVPLQDLRQNGENERPWENISQKAELAALDLELMTQRDEIEIWWWIEQVTRSRIDHCKLSWTRASIWARAWQEVTKAMTIVSQTQSSIEANHQIYLLVSPYEANASLSQAKFRLRHKHCLKPLYLPTGKKVTCGITPHFQDFQAFIQVAKQSPCREDAIKHLQRGINWLDRLPELSETDCSVLRPYLVSFN
ncbi:uncharacterized protein I206_107664 [Kwoniella pini CBS 10737]|uniref:NAA35-like N-terminal domain-containing protein n=1 Tax=Kwoniella pini CBS 10737 TaxID=1296096 RepID=A0AAJ8LBG2_9TREE